MRPIVLIASPLLTASPLLALLASCASGGGKNCTDGRCDDFCDTPGVALVAAFPGTPIEYPVAVKQSPDQRDQKFYVVEKGGRILAVEPTGDVLLPARSTTIALDLTRTCRFPEEATCVYRQQNGDPGWEEGMLDVAFHPQFPERPFVYVTYVAGRGDVMVWRLSRFEARFPEGDETRFFFDPDSELVMLADRKPEDTHNGGSLAFGPDGMLYASVGDGGGVFSEQPQNVNTIFGSILRIDVDPSCERGYRIPPDNPFAAPEVEGTCDLVGAGGRPEIYAWGVRNPWRMSFDRRSGDLWVGDVGQDAREAVFVIERGRNYGYPMIEGGLTTFKNAPGVCKAGCDRLAAPEIEIFHEGQAGTPPGAPIGNSVTGGYVYHPSGAVRPDARIEGLEGFYIYGDFMTTEIWAYQKGSGQPPIMVSRTGKRIAAFGEDRDGNLFVLDHQAVGGMYRLASGPCQSVNRPDNFYAFLSRDGINSVDDALAYYEALGIDPLSHTLDEWQLERFGVLVSECFRDDPPSACDDIVKSYYQNGMDLGFWREMYCSRTLGRGQGGCMVRNWTEEEDLALLGIDVLQNLGTVAMDVSPEGFTRFYAFGPDGVISPVAVLDSEGEKAVPNLCTPCHGGNRWVPGGSPDLGSLFREFEPSVLTPREGVLDDLFPGTDLAQYDKELFDLNQAILSANRALRLEAEGSPADFDSWRAAIIHYIENELYESDDPDSPISRLVTDPVHIPASWATGGTAAQIEAKEQLWMNVVHPYCVGCHRTNTKPFEEYSNFVGLAAVQGNESLLESYVTGEPGDPTRALAFMPQAELQFLNLQEEKAGDMRLDVFRSIRQWLQQVVNPSGPVCDIRFQVLAPTRPGQDVFVVGSIGSLGEWEPQNGLPLTWQRCTDGSCNLSVWEGTARLLRGTRIEFKNVMLSFNTGGPPTVVWEGPAFANRALEIPDDGNPVCEISVAVEFENP